MITMVTVDGTSNGLNIELHQSPMKRSLICVPLIILLANALVFQGCTSFVTASGEKASTYDIAVTEIVVRSVDENMSAIELWFSVKALVTNNTASPRTVLIGIQGIDRDGFELKDFIMRGSLEANETRFLTDRQYMPKDNFQKVVRWQVESVSYIE